MALNSGGIPAAPPRVSSGIDPALLTRELRLVVAVTRSRQGSEIIRTGSAAIILVCLSSAPYMTTTRWFTDVGLWQTAWPFVYTYWLPALAGGTLFILDVLVPLIGRSSAERRRVIRALVIPTAFAFWSLCSVFWTTAPTSTPSQSILLTLLLATAAWFGLALSFSAQVTALFVCTQLLTLGSLGSVVLVESARWSPFVGDRSWIGLFGNPNSLGPVAAFAAVCTVGFALIVDRRWWAALGMFATADLLVAVGATSVTAWIAFSAALITMASVISVTRRRIGWRPRVVWAGLISTSAIATLVLAERFMKLVGKDSTLSGRTVVWQFVADNLGSRWPIGFGYAGFWDDPETQRAYMQASGRDWVMSSHSSFIDALAWLGVVGLILLTTLVLFSVGRILWRALGCRDLHVAWWTGVAAFALVENVAESMMLSHSLFWLLLVTPGFVAVNGIPHRDMAGDLATPSGMAAQADTQAHQRRART